MNINNFCAKSDYHLLSMRLSRSSEWAGMGGAGDELGPSVDFYPFIRGRPTFLRLRMFWVKISVTG